VESNSALLVQWWSPRFCG